MPYKILVSLSFLIVALNACNKQEDNTADLALAEKHCGNCHLFPKPELLDKNNWEKVLPKMALLMGVTHEIKKQGKIDAIELDNLPDKPLVTEEEWNRIKGYYLSKAPYRLSFPLSANVQSDSKLFVGKSHMPASKKMPNITCVKIDTAKQIAYACDEVNQEIWMLDKESNAINHFSQHVAVSNIQILKDRLMLTYIGNAIDPTLKKHGYVKTTDLVDTDKNEILASNLARPTQTLSLNLDDSPEDELVINEFGLNKGAISVFKQKKNATQKYIISNSPGAINTIALDFDKDGKTDLITLFGQGDERIVWFKNNGNLQFTPTTLLRFPPVYGSSSFELTDFNKDGLLDILYTAGDNSDYSQELKPYHGVYIFINQGKTNFKETYFFQMNGAYKALARDFDLDGDLDIAATAFYVDYFEKTPKDFVYLENTGKGFTPKTLNIRKYGRWLAMDTGDIDGDGDDDIILGSHPIGATPGTLLKEWIMAKGVLLLVNQKNKTN